MSVSVEQILNDWKKNHFKPVYWLEGEEGYPIDLLTDYAEHRILSEQEASFNLSVFYGRDAAWADVVNACRRYPMFAERQVVLLKEAQHMKEIEKLEAYVEQPLPSTVFVVAHKEKKLDGRGSLAKLLKKKGEVLTTKKVPDHQMPEWASKLVHDKGYTITPRALSLLVDHIGNDLSRLSNEVDKLIVNLGQRREIRDEDIEKFIGVSREFNVFELQNALARRDLAKAMRIVEYFGNNPRAASIHMVLPALFAFFSKTYMMFSYPLDDPKALSDAMGVAPFFIKDNLAAAKTYGLPGIERILLLMHEYNLRSLGVNDAGNTDASLMKEMIVKMIQ
jgi:DNA polymerase III subunit delta